MTDKTVKPRQRFSYDENDTELTTWLDNQTDKSVSCVLAIKCFISMFGYADVQSNFVKVLQFMAGNGGGNMSVSSVVPAPAAPAKRGRKPKNKTAVQQPAIQAAPAVSADSDYDPIMAMMGAGVMASSAPAAQPAAPRARKSAQASPAVQPAPREVPVQQPVAASVQHAIQQAPSVQAAPAVQASQPELDIMAMMGAGNLSAVGNGMLDSMMDDD